MVMTLPKPPITPLDRLAQIDECTFLERVAIADMFVAEYGRPIGYGQIGRMLKSGYDPRKLGIVTTSMRADGRHALLDGNHRRHLAHHHGETHMLARVFIDLTYEEEAKLFAALNTVKPPSALDRWRARIEYAEPVAVEIAGVLADNGLRVGSTTKGTAPGAVAAVVALERIYHQRGVNELRECLTILRGAWDLDPSAFTNKMLEGLSHFWARYRGDANISRLVEQLQKTTPHRIQAQAGALLGPQESAYTAVGKQIVQIYTGRSAKYVLPDWKPKLTDHIETRGDVHNEAMRAVAPLDPDRLTPDVATRVAWARGKTTP